MALKHRLPIQGACFLLTLCSLSRGGGEQRQEYQKTWWKVEEDLLNETSAPRTIRMKCDHATDSGPGNLSALALTTAPRGFVCRTTGKFLLFYRINNPRFRCFTSNQYKIPIIELHSRVFGAQTTQRWIHVICWDPRAGFSPTMAQKYTQGSGKMAPG